MSFIKACLEEELWEGEMAGIKLQGKSILLFKFEGKVLAYDGHCPHQRVLLAEGCLDGKRVSCLAHHWEFDLRSGKGINPESVCLTEYKVKSENGEIWVEL